MQGLLAIRDRVMDVLTAEQQAELHRDLLGLRGELQRLVDTSEEGARPVALDQPIGRLSRMDAIAQQSMTKATREGAQLRLRQVDSALGRISRDGYGPCLECEEPVGFGRLKARPEALFCIACQNQRENR
jgi:DnaK suppressor protein